MKRRTAQQNIGAMLLAMLLVILLAAPCFAGWESIDLDRTDGAIRLEMVFRGRGEEYAMSGGEMSLYTVGPAAAGDAGYYFDTSAGRFAGTPEAERIAAMDSAELSAQNAELARALAAYAAAWTADQTAVISDGEAVFTELRPGLYLIAMTKEDDTGATITPFLMSLPDEAGNYDISARPKPEIEPPAPTPTPTPTPGPSENKLPQTGQLWWPVPVMLAAGVMLLAAGILLRRRNRSPRE